MLTGATYISGLLLVREGFQVSNGQADGGRFRYYVASFGTAVGTGVLWLGLELGLANSDHYRRISTTLSYVITKKSISEGVQADECCSKCPDFFSYSANLSKKRQAKVHPI